MNGVKRFLKKMKIIYHLNNDSKLIMIKMQFSSVPFSIKIECYLFSKILISFLRFHFYINLLFISKHSNPLMSLFSLLK